MRPISTIGEFRIETLAAGLGPMSDEELAFMKNYYDGAVVMTHRIREIIDLADEPASTFDASYVAPRPPDH
jgi:hypothetical protein